MAMKLREVASLTSLEKEKILPSYVQSILPRAQELRDDSKPPIDPRKDEWETLSSPRRFARTYHFKTRQQVTMFMLELLKYEESVDHGADIQIVGRDVSIKVWTHDLDDVTELDVKYAREADAIFDDVMIMFKGKK